MAEAANPLGVFEKSLGEAVAFAAGVAIAPLLRPYVQELQNVTWAGTPTKPLEPSDLAEAVAQGVVDAATAEKEAAMTGIAATPFSVLRKIADEGPDLGTALNLWRRGYISADEFTAAVKKAKFEDRWLSPIQKLKASILSPGELAAAIHRGLIPDPGLLKGEQPTPPFTVEPYPVRDIDAVAEAAGHGIDKDRLGVLVGLQGLPMGVIEAAHAYYRQIITHGDYIRAFNQSNNRNEWAEAVLEYARQIPTARDFFENALRGYHSFEWATEQAKRHGMTPEDSLVIYQNQGRPMNIRQITQALSRGAKFHPEPGELTDPYEASTVEGNVKPAYYEMFKALKYTLPSPFVMRSLTQSGTWTQAKAAKRLKDIGWIPEDADEAAADWAKGSGGSADPHVTKARNQLWTTTHRSFVAAESTAEDVTDELLACGVPAEHVADVLVLWERERALIRKQLTPANIAKGYKKAAVNVATGQPWTEDEAIDALVQRGYDVTGARNYLNIATA